MPARSSRHSSGRRTPRAARSSSTARWWSDCTPIWPGAPSPSRTRSRRWGISAPTTVGIAFFRHCEEQSDEAIHLPSLLDGLLRFARNDGIRRTKPLRRPGIQAAGNRRPVAAALRRNMQPDNFGIADQRRKILRLEEAFWFGMHGIKRFL